MSESRRAFSLASLSIGGVKLTRRGWAFIVASGVCFVAAYSGGRQELLYVATLAAALPIVAVLIVLVKRPKLSVTRTFTPHVIQAGTTTEVALAVRNLAPSRSMRARWQDLLPWFPHATDMRDLPALLARGPRFAGRGNSTSVGYDLRPPHRGIFSVGPMHVVVEDAFGLATSQHFVGETQQLIVTPEVIPLAETGLSIPAGDGEARLVQRRATGDDDDAMTREYRAGDAMRRVHWRASARHGDLMVRQEEQRSFPEARVIIDTRRAGYRDASDDYEDEAESAAFEWVVRMLASVAVHLRRMGFLVTVDETGTPQLDSVGRGRRRTWGDEEFLSSLAALSLVEDHDVRRTNGERASNGPTVAILGNPDVETLEWLSTQRRPGQLAVACMVQSTSSIDQINRQFGILPTASLVAELLADSGWLVVPVRADDDHAAAWEAVVVETGRARGNG
ncbi:DUF58 domain-containing protein [soil metagenome]